MANRDRAISVLTTDPMCDDCITKIADIRRRQIVNSIMNKECRNYLVQRRVHRAKGLCHGCRKTFKFVNRYAN